MKGRIVMMLIYLFFSIGLLTAQDATVQGIVVSSEDNEPVVGASVLVVGTSLGVTTDIDGKFVIQNVPDTGVIHRHAKPEHGYQQRDDAHCTED